MKKCMLLIAVVSLIALSLGTALADPNLNPGKWEITTQTEMAGMPGMIPPVTHTQCLGKETLVPQSEGESQECKISDIKQNGDKVSWKIVCSGKNGAMEGTGEITYKGDSMTGVMNLEIQGAGMQIKNTITGKRIGPCD
jgi:hypothetical protein